MPHMTAPASWGLFFFLIQKCVNQEPGYSPPDPLDTD